MVFLFLVFGGLLTGGYFIEVADTPLFFSASLVLLIAACSFLLMKRSYTCYSPVLFILLFAFLVYSLLSSLWSLNQADSFYDTGKTMLAVISFIICSSLIRSEENKTNALKSILLFTVICSLFVAVSLWYKTINTQSNWLETAFGHLNLLSSFLFLLLGITVLCFTQFQGTWRKMAIICSLIIFAELLILENRAVFLALFVFALVLAVLFRNLIKLRFRKSKYLLLGFSLALIAVFTMKSSTIYRLNFSTEAKASLIERKGIWINTIKLISDEPVFGVGAGNWQYNFTRYPVDHIESIASHNRTFQKAHNDYLELLSELGIAGFLLFLFIAIVLVRATIRQMRDGNKLSGIIFALFCGFSVIAFFSFPAQRLTHLLLLSFILAFLLSDSKKDFSLPGTFNLIIPAVLTLLLFIGGLRLWGEYHTKQLIPLLESNPALALAHIEKATNLFYQTDPTSTPLSSYAGLAYFRLGDKNNMLQKSEEAFKIAPFDYKVISNLAFALDLNGQKDSALKLYERSIHINPRYEVNYYNLFILEYNSGNYRSALRHLKKIPAYQSRYSRELYLLESKMK